MAALFGRRLRKGATTTAVAAVAIAALSASQAPGVVPRGTRGQAAEAIPQQHPAQPQAGDGSGDSSYYPDLPPLNSPNKPGGSSIPPTFDPIVQGAPEAGIPATVFAAYKQAEQSVAQSQPGCNLPWQLLAAIGKVESGQARGGRVSKNGTTDAPILGPVLNGIGFADITDTDHGAFDGDKVHDRAVGPMQFIPSTWEKWGADGNGDGKDDPNNVFDAALAAAHYLCADNRNLAVTHDLHQAILSYNNSQDYLNTVLSWFEYYKNHSTFEVPDGTGILPSQQPVSPFSPVPSHTPTTPPAQRPSNPPGTPKPGPTSPSPSPTPRPPVKPTPPATTPPSTTPTPPTAPPSTTPTPPPVATQLVKSGTGTLTAVAGALFGDRPAVIAQDASGKPVAGAIVQFTIGGGTDAHFTGDTSVTTGTDGVAAVPALQAGDTTGDFTVTATVTKGGTGTSQFTATVTAPPVPQADTLSRTDSGDQKAAPGAEFANAVHVKATEKGAAAGGVSVTATLNASADDVTPGDKGPFFKDKSGAVLHQLVLKTDGNGQLVVPTIFTDAETGTFQLHLTTADGGKLTIALTVEAAAS